jgi:translocator protein
VSSGAVTGDVGTPTGADDRGWGLLVASLLAVALVAGVGGLATDTGAGSWYATLEQPAWNPPDWLFGPVWTLLYVLMAVAAWLVARRGLDQRPVIVAVGVYAVQLVLNLSWTLVFFGLEAPAAALAVIVALIAAIVVTIRLFQPLHAVAAFLLVPYLVWVLYATALNAAIVALN